MSNARNRRRMEAKEARKRGPEPWINVFASTPKEAPILLSEPKHADLAAYGTKMLAALKAGYEQGLDEPCVLIVWRGGAYAKEHGLEHSPEPLVIRPIPGPELERLTGEKAYLSGDAREALPRYTFALALRDRFEVNTSIDLSDDAIALAWRHSQAFRRRAMTKFHFGEEEVRLLEERTGISRND